jgi:hypothetical protein
LPIPGTKLLLRIFWPQRGQKNREESGENREESNNSADKNRGFVAQRTAFLGLLSPFGWRAGRSARFFRNYPWIGSGVLPLLELARRRERIISDDHTALKAQSEEIARMLSGLIDALENRDD